MSKNVEKCAFSLTYRNFKIFCRLSYKMQTLIYSRLLFTKKKSPPEKGCHRVYVSNKNYVLVLFVLAECLQNGWSLYMLFIGWLKFFVFFIFPKRQTFFLCVCVCAPGNGYGLKKKERDKNKHLQKDAHFFLCVCAPGIGYG